MNRRYGHFQQLRGRPARIETRVSREAYVRSREQALSTAKDEYARELVPAFAAIGPAADF